MTSGDRDGSPSLFPFGKSLLGKRAIFLRRMTILLMASLIMMLVIVGGMTWSTISPLLSGLSAASTDPYKQLLDEDIINHLAIRLAIAVVSSFLIVGIIMSALMRRSGVACPACRRNLLLAWNWNRAVRTGSCPFCEETLPGLQDADGPGSWSIERKAIEMRKLRRVRIIFLIGLPLWGLLVAARGYGVVLHHADVMPWLSLAIDVFILIGVGIGYRATERRLAALR